VPIDVEGMWPYWLDEAGRAPATVHNDLAAMGSMYLLTGARGLNKLHQESVLHVLHWCTCSKM
jgi:hypothetical protein